MTQKALTIQQFCQEHSISKNLFYKLKKSGFAPRTISLGARQLITIEEAEDWRRRMVTLSNSNSETSP